MPSAVMSCRTEFRIRSASSFVSTSSVSGFRGTTSIRSPAKSKGNGVVRFGRSRTGIHRNTSESLGSSRN